MSFSKKEFVQIDADFNFEEPDLSNDCHAVLSSDEGTNSYCGCRRQKEVK